MGQWVGPAIIAAAIAALVSILGWFVSTRQALALDRLRRLEKTRDLQIALRAEIRSELANLQSYDLDVSHERMAEQLGEGSGPKVVVLKSAPNLIFHSLVGEIHLLPPEVIDPVVVYMRQCAVVETMIDTLTAEDFQMFSRARKLSLAADYFDLRKEQRAMALEATKVLDRSIGLIASRRGADRSAP